LELVGDRPSCRSLSFDDRVLKCRAAHGHLPLIDGGVRESTKSGCIGAYPARQRELARFRWHAVNDSERARRMQPCRLVFVARGSTARATRRGATARRAASSVAPGASRSAPRSCRPCRPGLRLRSGGHCG
jgi:hypothetical protein